MCDILRRDTALQVPKALTTASAAKQEKIPEGVEIERLYATSVERCQW